MSTILIIDDDPAILEALQIALETKGYRIVTTDDADMAVALATTHRPDLILLDYLLSGSNGIEIIEDLHRSKELRSIPIIMLSAHPSAQNQAKHGNATAFLPKPFDLSILYEIVGQYT